MKRVLAVAAIVVLLALGFGAAMTLASSKRDARSGVCSETCTTSLTPSQRLEAHSSR